MLISLEAINKGFGSHEVLKNITATIEDNDRCGLIGANGTGKTTLLNIISGQEYADGGEVFKATNLSVGYLKQNSGLEQGSTIYDEMRRVFAPLLKLEQQIKELQQRLTEPELQNNPSLFGAISREYAQKATYFEQQDGYRIDVKIQTILNGMGFLEKDTATPICTLSGGEKTRLAMAKLLLEQPQLLILDEPTNHLDFRTLMWLEEYLQSYKGAVLVVSHDRYFLDKCVTSIWELEDKELTCYKGNYSKYTVLKAEFIERRLKEYEIQQQQIASMEDYVARNMARASTSKSARSRQNALDKMEIIEKPKTFNRTVKMLFEYDREPVKDVLDIQNLAVTVGNGVQEQQLCPPFSLHLFRGEKLAVIGANGAGKSTLLKTIQAPHYQEHHIVEWGRNVKIGFYDQQMELLNPQNTVLEELWGRYPRMTEQQVRTALGRVMLIGENVFKNVSVLSGGERARLTLAILMMERPNVLIMDEPTNHLDLATKEVLEEALTSFSGTLILVSHDRYLLNRVPTQILELTKSAVGLYQGKFDDYLQKKQQAPTDSIRQKKTDPDEKKAVGINTGGYKSKEQKSMEAKRRLRVKQLEQLIEECEELISQLERQMETPEVFSDYVAAQQICEQLEEQRMLHQQLFEEWAVLCEE